MPPTAAPESAPSSGSTVIQRSSLRDERYVRAPGGDESRRIGLGDAASILSAPAYASVNEALLESAAQHQRALKLGAERLIGITGIDKASPAVRLSWLPLTVADAMRLGVVPTDAAARCIAACALGGAQEMLELRDRAHGAVTPGNIYIDTSRIEALEDGPVCRLGLCAPSATVEDAGAASWDVHEVGRVLFELIQRTAYSERGAWPLADGPAWHALGPQGDAWRQLCNDMLHPNGSERPSAAEALTRLESIRAAPVRRKRGPGAWIAAAVVAAAIGGGAFVLFGPSGDEDSVVVSTEFDRAAQAQWAELCDKTESWFLRLAEELPSASPLDEHLRGSVLGAIQRARADGVALDPRVIAGRTDRVNRRALAEPGSVPEAAQRVEGIAQTAEALRVVRAVEQSLAAEAWPALAAVLETAAAWQDRGWVDMARALELRAEAAAPAGGGALADGIAALVAAREQAASVESAWATLLVAFESTAASGDPLLGRFEPYARQQAERARAPGNLNDRLQALERLAVDLSEAAATRLPELDAALLRAELTMYDDNEPDEDTFRSWLAAIEDETFERLDPSADPHPALALADRQRALASTLADASLVGIDDETLTSVRSRTAALGEEIAANAAKPWNRRTRAAVQREAGEHSSALVSLEQTASALQRAAAMDPDALIAALTREASITGGSSVVLDGAWQARRDAAIRAFGDDGNRLAFARAIESARRTLSELGASVPTPELPTDRPERLNGTTWASALVAARESALAAALAGDGEAVARHAALLSSGRDLLADLAEAERLLVGLYPPDAPGEAGVGASELIERARARPAFEAFGAADACAAVLRLHAETVAAAGATDAGSSLTDGAAPVRFSGWRALGSSSITPVLLVRSTEAARAIAAGVGDEARRTALLEEVRRTSVARWAALCTAARDANALEAALEAGSALGFGREDAPDAATAYNAAVYAFARSFDGSADDDTARARATDFIGTLGSGPGDGLATSLGALLDPSRDAGPSRDPATLGPGAAGWALVESSADNTRVVFGYPRRSPTVTLSFSAVFPEDGPAVYLAEQELSVGALNTVAGGMRLWDELAAGSVWVELAEQRGGAGASLAWDGPRSWRWAGTQLGRNLAWVFRHPTMSRDADGLIALTTPDVDPALNPGPRVGHPVQQMSPAAARVFLERIGCVLPSVAAWNAAVDHEARAPGGSAAEPNLRDAAWLAQRDYTARRRREGRQAAWPDGGVFDDTGAPTRAQATAGATDDGVVWFTETGDGPGETFKNLVGNVAEFVATSDGGMAVVGASALSPWGVEGAAAVRVVAPTQATGWSDVGLRPSFEATDVRFRRPLAAEIAALLSPPPYVLAPGE